MRSLPPKLLRRYQDFLNASQIDRQQQAGYVKWFRYYYDFCLKYSLKGTHPDTGVSFLEKLRSKGQTDAQIRQADKAVALYKQLAANMASSEGRIGSEVNCENEPFQVPLQTGSGLDQITGIEKKVMQRGNCAS